MKIQTEALLATLATLAALTFATVGAAHAATITHIATLDVGGSEINVSVFDGKAAYDGNGASGQLGDGTLTDYRLFRDDELNAVETFASKGTRIGDITKSGDYSFNRREYLDFWTTTDPGTVTGGIPAFSSTPDYDFSVDGEYTAIGHDGLTGTVDISGLASGSLYFIYGTYNDGYTLELTMSGPGQTDVSDSVDVNGGGTSQNNTVIDGYWISEFTFDNAAGDYDSIAYDISGLNGHYSGVVMDSTAIPEPGTFALLIAGLLSIVCVRRRR